jgi:threonine dehydratase
MLNVEGIVVEPAGALAIDALKDFKKSDIKGKRIVLVISGSNFDFERLPELKERSLRYEGLKKYFIFRFPQRPGGRRCTFRIPQEIGTQFRVRADRY